MKPKDIREVIGLTALGVAIAIMILMLIVWAAGIATDVLIAAATSTKTAVEK